METLSERLGRERVSLLVKAPYAELYQGNPRLHRVFTVRGKFRWGGLKEKLEDDPHRLALIANMTEPDLVPFLWRCGVRGFLRYRTRWTRYPGWMANEGMLRRLGAADYATGHAIENNLAMAKALGIEPTTHRLSLPHLRAEPSERENLVLIHPGASREIKRWPVENWARLGDALARQIWLPHCPDRRPQRAFPRRAYRREDVAGPRAGARGQDHTGGTGARHQGKARWRFFPAIPDPTTWRWRSIARR